MTSGNGNGQPWWRPASWKIRDSLLFTLGVIGLSNEVRHKLEAIRPATLGQAARIEGVTAAALTLVLAHVKGLKKAASA